MSLLPNQDLETAYKYYASRDEQAHVEIRIDPVTANQNG